ncbi:MAG: hypothetical protein ACOX78_08435 [Lachnospiraceae bacterium]|jgi:hypothetical protein
MSVRKKVLRFVAFFAVFFLLVKGCDYVFMPYGVTEFLLRNVGKEDEDYDFIIVGSSHAAYAYDPQVISDSLDVNAYTLAVPGETVNQSIDVIKYAIETNHVKTVLFDVDWQYFWNEETESGQLYETKYYAVTPMSETKISELFRNCSTYDIRGAISGASIYQLTLREICHNLYVKSTDSYKNATVDEVNKKGMPDNYQGRGWFSAPDMTEDPGGKDYVDSMVDESQSEFAQVQLEKMAEIKNLCDAHGVRLVCFSVPTTPYAESVWDLDNIHTQLASYFDSVGIEWYDGYYLKQSVFPRTNTDFRDLEGHITGSAGSRYTQVVAEIIQKVADGTYVESDYFETMPGVDTQ